MPQNEEPLSADARGRTHAPSDLAFRRSLRASRARRAASARATARRLRTRGGAYVVCGAFALGGGSAVAAGQNAGSAPAPPPAATEASPSPTTVQAAQRKLGVTVDGIIGPVTRAAIRALQRERGLPVSGRLDTSTRSVLGLRARKTSSGAEGGAVAGETPKRERDAGSTIPPELRSTLERIAECESGGNPRAVSPNGLYRGKYQFSRPTWRTVGGTGDPAKASEREQDRRAASLYKREGAAPWPHCGRA